MGRENLATRSSHGVTDDPECGDEFAGPGAGLHANSESKAESGMSCRRPVMNSVRPRCRFALGSREESVKTSAAQTVVPYQRTALQLRRLC